NHLHAVPVAPSTTLFRAAQTITFAPLGGKTFGDIDFLVSATGGGSGNAVTFTTLGPCALAASPANTVHITGAGDCTVTAHQAGNVNCVDAELVALAYTIE